MTEIFIEPELENLSIEENASEWFELCKQLGLEKQIQHADKSEEKQAPPYMFIDPKTARVIRTLCPEIVECEKYSASTIPLDILKEIAKCKAHGWYKKILIAYDDKTPDPFVIGQLHGTSDWDAKHHLIARWGAEILPFEQLERKAILRLVDAAQGELIELKAKVDNAIANPELFAKSMLSGKEAPRMNFSVGSITSGSFLPF